VISLLGIRRGCERRDKRREILLGGTSGERHDVIDSYVERRDLLRKIWR